MRDLSALEPVRRMMNGETGVTRFFSPALQEEVITGFSTVPKVGWGVMIPQPLSELAAHVSRVQRAVWSVIGTALLCAPSLASSCRAGCRPLCAVLAWSPSVLPMGI